MTATRKSPRTQRPAGPHTVRGQRQDGTLIDVEARGVRTEYDGKPAIIGTLLDITEHRRAELGYAFFDESFRGKGLMAEAVKAVIAYGFHQMDLHRIEAHISPHNLPSLKLIRKFHFTEEGLLRKHYFTNGVREDSKVFSLLREEFEH